MAVYRLLIADDEPLVQIGLKSMLSKGFEEIQVVGTASNGQEAFQMIGDLQVDIVIADIRMPLMSGLDLLQESARKYGPLPVFIMLTAYEELDLVRRALSLQAVDYLIKIELSADALHTAIRRAILRAQPYKKQQSDSAAAAPIESFRQKFLLSLFNRGIRTTEELEEGARRVGLSLDAGRYIVAYAVLNAPETVSGTSHEKDHLLTLYSSCFSMTRKIVDRYLPCSIVSNDMQHFTLLFGFAQSQPVAEIVQQIQEAAANASSMILSYFSVPLFFGIGTCVSAPLSIPDSYEEAKTAAGCADTQNPVRLFSHIVGANRQSGKDKLIAAIRQYIDENLDGKLQLTEVSKVFGLSPAYLSMIFKKNSDVGFSEYVYTRKIEKAKQLLLQNDMKIYEVADALGFESAYYFSRVFRKVEGISPREYIAQKTGKDTPKEETGHDPAP